MRQTASTRRHRRGAAAMELAMIAPLLVLLLFGALEIGQFVNASQAVSNASREGARKATRVETTTVAEVKATVEAYLSEYGNVPSSAVSVTISDEDGEVVTDGDLSIIGSGELIWVDVSVQFDSIRWFSFFDFVHGSQIPNSTAMRRE